MNDKNHGRNVRRVPARGCLKKDLPDPNKKYRTLFDRAADGIMIMSTDGKDVSVNDSFAKMHGYAGPGEMEGVHLPDLDNPETAKLAKERLRRILAGETLSFEVEHYRKDGSIFTLSVSCNLIRIGGRSYFLGFHRDITEYRKAEAFLANAQKLESLGMLAGGIAHDFNNILATIAGNLSLLRSRLEPGGEEMELVEEAEMACVTSARLACQLLTFAKGGHPVIKVLDLRGLLAQAVTFAARGTMARCVLELGDAPLAVKADQAHIFQVVQNLVVNAAQAMPEGGNITVRASAVTLRENEFPTLAAGKYVRVEFKDEGIGIQPEHLGKIFDPYFSTKSAGRGLGLTICYSIMSKHGGFISVSSKPGSGTTFTLHFPAAQRRQYPAGRKKRR
jgi:PAS domain S-box-containing protein